MAIIPSTGKFRNKLETLWRVCDNAWFGRDTSTYEQAPAILNGEFITGVNAAGTGTVNIIGVDSNNLVQIPSAAVLTNPTITEINSQYTNPAMLKTVTYNLTLNGSLGTQTFFIADRAYSVVGINAVWKTAGTVAGATLNVTKDTGTTVPGAGSTLQTGTFDLTATANTVLPGVLTATAASLSLVAGDRLAVKYAGTLTTLAGVVVTVTLSPSSLSETAMYFCRVNGDIATTSFFQANRDLLITGVKAVYGTAFAGAVTIDVTKDTGTTAAGGGTSVLTAAMAGDGTINTVITPALAASAATLAMAAGDRLAVKFSATTTGAGVAVLVSFAPIYNRAETSWQLALNAQQQVAQCFFVADRNYEIVSASCIFDVAAGGAAKMAVTIDKATTVPGGGSSVQTDNTNAGFDLNATARTTQFATMAGLQLRLLSPGDRLGLKVSGAAQSIADVAVTCSLRPWY